MILYCSIIRISIALVMDVAITSMLHSSRSLQIVYLPEEDDSIDWLKVWRSAFETVKDISRHCVVITYSGIYLVLMRWGKVLRPLLSWAIL